MWPLWQIVVSVVGAWLALQAGIIAILAVVAQQRKRRQLLHKFPHYDPPQTRLGDNQLKIYSYGQYLYTDMLAAIDAAQERIYIESFIWKDDAIGLAFKEHLAAKAQAGTLTEEEQTEVEAYSRVGSLLGILRSKARKALKGKRSSIRNAKTR